MIKTSNSFIRITNSLTFASLIAFLAATPTVAFSGSTDCTPSDQAALYACFHRAELNVVDGLDVYTRDLSAYGTPRSASGVRGEAPIAAKSISGISAKVIAAPRLDMVTLRAFFRSAAFNISDGIDVYGGDYRANGISQSESRTRQVAQRPR